MNEKYRNLDDTTSRETKNREFFEGQCKELQSALEKARTEYQAQVSSKDKQILEMSHKELEEQAKMNDFAQKMEQKVQ